MADFPVHCRHLPYVSRLDSRSAENIDLVIVHCTELPDLVTARQYGEKIVYEHSLTGNSGHYYIERSGLIEEWVPPDRIAHHTRGYNPRSIGIELDNMGRYPDWYDSRRQRMTRGYPAAQLDSLVALLQRLCDRLPALRWISGHSDLDRSRIEASDNPSLKVFRKRDPGPMFPWDDFMPLISLDFFKP